jgi:tetratricopeptide (TPR) repeat protein
MFDVFVSYRHADAADVRPLAHALKAAGLTVWFDESGIEDFGSIQHAIEDGLSQSKTLLAWYSRRYPESLACQWELTHAFTAAQQQGDPRVRVLLVNPEDTNEHIHPVELRDALYRGAARDADTLQSVAAAVKAHTAQRDGTFGAIRSRSKPAWYGAAGADGSNRFYGRLRELWAIHSGLWRSDVPIITNDSARPLVRLTGIAGSGKSLTAEMYGMRFGAAYGGGIFWLRAFGHETGESQREERTALRDSQLIDVALAHGIETAELDAARIRQALGERLRAGAPYLWIVDDLPAALSWQEAQTWLAPSANGRTLITMRGEAFGWAGAQVNLEGLDDASALALLTHARTPETDAEGEAARALMRDLGHHPLALELAAVAVRARGYADFRESLNAPSRDAMDFAASLMQARGQTLPHRDQADLNLSHTLLQSVRTLPEGAQDVLRLASQLAPVRISSALVALTLEHANAMNRSDARDAADLAMAALVAQCLAREPEPGTVLVHALVSRAMRYRDTDEARRAALRASSLPALEALLGDDIFDVRLHAKLSDTIAHARFALASATAEAANMKVPEARLLDALYMFDSHHGNYPSARRVAECLIDYSRAQLGPDHAHTLLFMTRLGRMQSLSGDLAAALRTQKQLLDASRRASGDDHPQTLTAQSDMALTLFKQGKLSQARSIQEYVLERRTRILGAEHEDTLTAMNNLATTLATRGDLAAARSLQERVVELRCKVLGPGHAESLSALNNLSVTLRALGDASGARGIQESLIAARGADVDESLPDNLTAMNNLAASLHSQGDLAGARSLMQRVFELRRRQLGERHPDTLATMNNLAAIAMGQGDYTEAKALLARSLEACRDTLGGTHPETLKAAFHLVITLVRTNEPADRVREVIERDLAPIVGEDPASLSVELRELRARLMPILASAATNDSASKPWWKRIF